MNYDKEKWGPGPWQDEPDRLEWRDPATKLPCMIIRNHQGALCGYVGVPPGHKYFKEDYNDVPVSVHGGLTYGAECSGHICHVPEPGEPDHVWWLGFDCGHAGDISPAFTHLNLSQYGWEQHYRDVEYVRAEVTQLAKQVHDAV